ncbi:MAG: hypothetical protein QM784_00920 [Polyangiaceae bacterium]
MRLNSHFYAASLFSLVLGVVQTSNAEGPAPAPGASPPAPNPEAGLGEFVVTGTKVEHVTKLAVLPSLAPEFEDVIVRSVVRRDLELSAMFELVAESKAPPGNYQFDDAVDVDAWKKVGAEVIVKVAARKLPSRAGDKPGENKIEVVGLAYLPEHGKEPVYERRFQTASDEIRMTAHRVTDALLGAITGRPGGFSSRFAFSTRWGQGRRLMTMDADGEGLVGVTDPKLTAISPTWGPEGVLFYSESRDYSPFRLLAFTGTGSQRLDIPFKTSIYASAVAPDKGLSPSPLLRTHKVTFTSGHSEARIGRRSQRRRSRRAQHLARLESLRGSVVGPSRGRSAFTSMESPFPPMATRRQPRRSVTPKMVFVSSTPLRSATIVRTWS